VFELRELQRSDGCSDVTDSGSWCCTSIAFITRRHGVPSLAGRCASRVSQFDEQLFFVARYVTSLSEHRELLCELGHARNTVAKAVVNHPPAISSPLWTVSALTQLLIRAAGLFGNDSRILRSSAGLFVRMSAWS